MPPTRRGASRSRWAAAEGQAAPLPARFRAPAIRPCAARLCCLAQLGTRTPQEAAPHCPHCASPSLSPRADSGAAGAGRPLPRRARHGVERNGGTLPLGWRQQQLPALMFPCAWAVPCTAVTCIFWQAEQFEQRPIHLILSLPLQARLLEAQAATAALGAAQAESAELVRRVLEMKDKEADRMNEINRLEAETVRRRRLPLHAGRGLYCAGRGVSSWGRPAAINAWAARAAPPCRSSPGPSRRRPPSLRGQRPRLRRSACSGSRRWARGALCRQAWGVLCTVLCAG